MLGKRSAQLGFFEADNLYLDMVGRDSFYGFLASQRGQMFHDADFARLYCADNGRNGVSPSLLATVLLLQSYEGVSDEEAKARADFDLRWKVALGIGIEERPFAKSTLQLFRAHLILHEQVRMVFARSLEFARETGYLRKHRVKVALDTTNILGRGAVKDTYNLLADGIVRLARVLALLSESEVMHWAEEHSLSRYFGKSVKGEAQIDWGDSRQKEQLLQSIVADADRLLALARERLFMCQQASAEGQRLREAAELLSQLLLQDIERKAEGAVIKEGVSADRVISVQDPEMRHGHKSKAKRFDGHKAAMAVDTESQLITALTVLPGNAADSDQALELVCQSEKNAQVEVEESLGDCAYGDGATRQAFADAGRVLRAAVPKRPKRGFFDKEDFTIDVQAKTCCCPAGQISYTLRNMGSLRDRHGQCYPRQVFEFDATICSVCHLRSACVAAGPGKGRTVSLHPQEALLQEARKLQHSAAWAPYRELRQVAEHRIARLTQLRVRQARYFGRIKTLFQLLMAATVANLTLVATKTGLMHDRSRAASDHFSSVLRILDPLQGLFRLLLAPTAPKMPLSV